MVSWLAGCFCGLVAAARMPCEERQRQSVERWKRQWRRWVAGASSGDTGRGSSLRPLRELLLGRSRAEIAAILGPPTATSQQPRSGKPGAYWEAETWYYPIDLSRRRGVAITFTKEVVRDAEEILGPG